MLQSLYRKYLSESGRMFSVFGGRMLRHTHSRDDTVVDDELLKYLSPLGWEHINLTGDYIWKKSSKLKEGKFRPLRAVKFS
jgi:hypothetical protein